jgi:hypothetical protein
LSRSATRSGWGRARPDERILDLGDISAARGTAMYLALWLRLWRAIDATHFNIAIARA